MTPDVVSKIVRRMLRLLPVSLQLKVDDWYSRCRARLLGPGARAVLTTSWNGDLLVGTRDLTVGRALAFRGAYDRGKIEALRTLLTPASDLLVVGAHVGSVLIPLARNARRAVGIEANPATFALLEMNVRLNALANIELYHRAAGERAGVVRFLMNRHNTGGSKVVRGESASNILFTYDRPETVTVPCERLDDLLGDRSFDLMVMDIEGSEYFALRGMPRLLERCGALQIEISRLSIEQAAGITPLQFLEPLRDVFDSAQTSEGGVVREFAREAFDDLLRFCMRTPDISYDVLFRKKSR